LRYAGHLKASHGAMRIILIREQHHHAIVSLNADH